MSVKNYKRGDIARFTRDTGCHPSQARDRQSWEVHPAFAMTIPGFFQKEISGALWVYSQVVE
jgi:hypothetical protein